MDGAGTLYLFQKGKVSLQLALKMKKNGVSNKEKIPKKSRNDNLDRSLDKINSKNQKMNKTAILEEKKVKKKSVPDNDEDTNQNRPKSQVKRKVTTAPRLTSGK